MYKKMRGVSLVELMIVIVVLGILAAVAYPNYRDFVARGKRNEAKAALLQIASNQERVYLNTNSYTEDMVQLGFSQSDDWETASGSYTIDVDPGADSNNFSATATYILADATELGKCATFTIDGRGNRGSAPAGDCWTRTR